MGCGSSNSIGTRAEEKSNNYSYTPEERNLLANLMQKVSNLEDQHMVFNKHDIFISEKEGIVYREYRTIKIVTEKYPHSGSYEYVPMYINEHKVKILDIRINNIKSKDYKYEETENSFKISIPYTVEKTDDPLFTFEVVFSLKNFLAEFFASVDLAYDTENSCFSCNFSLKDFHFLSVAGEIPEKYKLDKQRNKVSFFGDIYEGDFLMELQSFTFSKDAGMKLDKIGKMSTDFYFLDKSELKMVEEGINSMAKDICLHQLNLVFSRDIYKFVDDKAYVKTYLIFFYPKPLNDPVEDNDCDFDIHGQTDLKIINFKISNKPWESNHTIENDMCFFKPKISFVGDEYFRTIEFEYSFTLDYNKEGFAPIAITKHPSLVGGNYELYIKKAHGRNITFARNINPTTSQEYDIVYKSVYKTFEDDIYYLNVINVYR